MLEIRDIHEPLMAWLNKANIPFHRSRSDKATTGTPGDPDFLICRNDRCLYIECKVPGKTLSPEQQERHEFLKRAGNTVHTVYSYQEAMRLIAAHFSLIDNVQVNVDAANAIPEPAKKEATNLYIKNFLGVDRVFEGSGKDGTINRILRTATPQDIQNIPRK